MAVEQVFAPPPFPASGRVTPAAFPFFTTGEDNLRIVTYNARANVKVQVVARLLGTDGRPSAQRWDHTPNTDRSAKSDDFPLSGLTILNLQVTVIAGAPVLGQTFVLMQLIRGVGTAALVLGTIASGYVSPARAVGWPGSPLESTLDSGGYYRTITGTTPAAGAEITETCPTGARWDVVSVNTSLVPVIDHNPRICALSFNTGGTYSFAAWPRAAYNADRQLQWIFSQSPELSDILFKTRTEANVPICQPSTLLAGDFFQTSTDGLIAGDQFNPPTYLVREWLEP